MNPKDLVGAQKAPLGVVPPSLVPFTAPAMAVGAAKYGPFNWRAQPVQMMTYIEAAQRHLYAFLDGQDLAEDTGVHHIAHAIAGLAIVADAIASGNVIDNRPPAGPTADILRAQDRSNKPADAEPKVYPVDRMTCVECGVTLPDHRLECRNWGFARFDGEDGMAFEYKGFPASLAADGCLMYRGRHIHPLSMTTDVLDEIGRMQDLYGDR